MLCLRAHNLQIEMRKEEGRKAAINLKQKEKCLWWNENKEAGSSLIAGKINRYLGSPDSDLVVINSVKVNYTCMNSTLAHRQFYYQYCELRVPASKMNINDCRN